MIAPQKQEIFPRPFNENYDLIGTLGRGGMGNMNGGFGGFSGRGNKGF